MGECRRLRIGQRLTLFVEPRDAWVGVYVSPKAIYVCLLPFVVIRWERRWVNIGADFRRLRVGRP